MPKFNTRDEYEAWKAQRSQAAGTAPAPSPSLYTPSHDFYGPPESDKDAVWAAMCHLATLVCFVFPLGNIVGPWLVWLARKDTSTFVRAHGQEAYTFQICVTIVMFGSLVVALPLSLLAPQIVPVLAIVVLGSMAYGMLMPLVAAFYAWSGRHFRYPFIYRY